MVGYPSWLRSSARYRAVPSHWLRPLESGRSIRAPVMLLSAIGAASLHFHDLRHTGNQFAANSGAALKDLMAQMGHDSECAALIFDVPSSEAV